LSLTAAAFDVGATGVHLTVVEGPETTTLRLEEAMLTEGSAAVEGELARAFAEILRLARARQRQLGGGWIDRAA